jgi:uroporphyrinogen-III synthase
LRNILWEYLGKATIIAVVNCSDSDNNFMKKVFISRHLDDGSIFYKTLKANGFAVHGESLLTFNPVPFASPQSFDWVFFYSKTAVRFFLDNGQCPNLEGKKLAAIGEGTANALIERGHHPHFIGDGEPVTAAARFLEVAKGRRILFPRAKESRQSIQRLLGDAIFAVDLVVYENTPRTDFTLSDYQILVFTSPMNALAYFSIKTWKGEAVVAIGNTTASALHQIGIEQVHVATAATEEALATLVLELAVFQNKKGK